MKKLTFLFLLIIFFGSQCQASVIVTQNPIDNAVNTIGNSVENAANTISNGMVQSAVQGALYNAMLKKAAEDRAIARRVAQVRGRLVSILQGYTKEQHKKYMKLIENSPDVSYSLKVGVLNICNAYREARDSVDAAFLKRYRSWAESVAKIHEASLRELMMLLNYFNPNEKRKLLNKEIDKIGLGKNIRRELDNLVRDYYGSRSKMDGALKKTAENLTATIAE